MKMRVKINDQTFEVEVGDLQARPIQAIVDGESFEIFPEESEVLAAPVATVEKPAPAAPAPRPAPAAANPAAEVNASKAVMSPLPGVILSIAVKAGDTVKPGQELCVLEAKKMRNPIRAGRAAAPVDGILRLRSQNHGSDYQSNRGRLHQLHPRPGCDDPGGRRPDHPGDLERI